MMSAKENRRDQVDVALYTVLLALESYVQDNISSDEEEQKELFEAWKLIWEIVHDNC